MSSRLFEVVWGPCHADFEILVVRIRSAIASFPGLTDGAHSCLVLAVTFPPFTMFREVWPGVCSHVVVTLPP